MNEITITHTRHVDEFKNLLYNCWHYSNYWCSLDCDPAFEFIKELADGLEKDGNHMLTGTNRSEQLRQMCIEDKLWYYLKVDPSHRIEVEDTYSDEKFSLRWDMIVEGSKVFANDFPRHYQDFVGDNDDAITADCWLQCVCLGDVKYG